MLFTTPKIVKDRSHSIALWTIRQMKILEFPPYNIATKFVEITNGRVIWHQCASVDIDSRLESV